jgi:hypothetical protein
LDGRVTSYFEWLPAGRVETEVQAGTMTAADRRAPLVQSLYYGFDLERLYVRVDFGQPAASSLKDGLRCTLHFVRPTDVRVILRGEGRRPTATLIRRTADGAVEDFVPTAAAIAAADVLEASVPFADLGLRAGDPFAFFVSLQTGSIEHERHPGFRPIEGHVPGSDFEELRWRA